MSADSDKIVSTAAKVWLLAISWLLRAAPMVYAIYTHEWHWLLLVTCAIIGTGLKYAVREEL